MLKTAIINDKQVIVPDFECKDCGITKTNIYQIVDVYTSFLYVAVGVVNVY